MPSTAPAGARQLMRKALATPAKATPRRAVQVEPEGIVRAIVSVTGIVDAVEDLIVPGAYAATLKRRRPKVVDDHEWQRKAGRVLHIEEWMSGDKRLPKTTKDGQPWPAEAGALVATIQYNLRSDAGRESYEWVRFYAESSEAEFSVGYKVPPGKARKRHDGVRVILEVDLFELSHVLFGAAPLSMALEVKNVHGQSAGQVSAPALNLTDDDEDDDDTKLPAVDSKKPWEKECTKPKARMEAKSAAAVLADARGLDVLEVKQARMRGSYEDRTRLIEAAVLDLLNSAGDDCYTWVNPIATYDHEVIVTAYISGDQGERSFVIPYTFNAVSGTVELDAPQPVEVSLTAAVPRDEQGDEDTDEPTEGFRPFDGTLRMLESMWGMEGKAADAARARVMGLVETKGADQGPVYDADNLPDGDFGLYSKTEPIEAIRLDGAFTVDTREGRVTTPDGWLALDSGGFPYPIAADEFDEVYAPYEDTVETPSPEEGLETKVPEPAEDETEDAEPVEAEETVTIPAAEVEENAALGADELDEAPEPPPAPADAPEGDDETVKIDPDEHFALMEDIHSDDEDPDEDPDES